MGVFQNFLDSNMQQDEICPAHNLRIFSSLQSTPSVHLEGPESRPEGALRILPGSVGLLSSEPCFIALRLAPQGLDAAVVCKPTCVPCCCRLTMWHACCQDRPMGATIHTAGLTSSVCRSWALFFVTLLSLYLCLLYLTWIGHWVEERLLFLSLSFSLIKWAPKEVKLPETQYVLS